MSVNSEMTGTAGPSCQEIVELVTDYLDGALPLATRQRFEAHLAICPFCRIYLEQMRATIQAAGRLRADDLDRLDRDRLVELFRSWRF